jgi:hypothetical protein
MLKLMYLALENISKKWTMPIHNWRSALNHFQLFLKCVGGYYNWRAIYTKYVTGPHNCRAVNSRQITKNLFSARDLHFSQNGFLFCLILFRRDVTSGSKFI